MPDDTGAAAMVSAIRRLLARTVDRPGTVGYGVGVAVPLALWCVFGAVSVFVDGLHISRILEWWDGMARLPVQVQLAYVAGFCGACSAMCYALAARLLRADVHTGNEVANAVQIQRRETT